MSRLINAPTIFFLNLQLMRSYLGAPIFHYNSFSSLPLTGVIFCNTPKEFYFQRFCFLILRQEKEKKGRGGEWKEKEKMREEEDRDRGWREEKGKREENLFNLEVSCQYLKQGNLQFWSLRFGLGCIWVLEISSSTILPMSQLFAISVPPLVFLLIFQETRRLI